MLSQIFNEDFAKRLDGVRFVGPKLAENTVKAPVIIWQPVSAVHIAPRRIGGGPGDDGDILTREWTIVVEVYGRTLDETENLTNVFLGAAHEWLSRHGYTLGSEQWDPGGQTAGGSLCVLSFKLRTPIPRTPKPTREITNIAGTYKLGNTQV